MGKIARDFESHTLSRRGVLQASAGAVAGSTMATLFSPASSSAALVAGSNASSCGGALPIPQPRINAFTGGSYLSAEVLGALTTQEIPVGDPAFIDLFLRTTKLAASILRTKSDVLVIPAEAIVPLEAAFRSVTRPGMTALNLVSGEYGAGYTTWLETYGAKVIQIVVPFNESIDPRSVEAAFAQHPEIELMSVVHVDTPSGTKNAIDKICPIAKRHGAVTLVDAASTYGGMPLYPDEWGIDISVGAPAKNVDAPLAVGIINVSDDAWKLIAKNPDAPADFSFLSLTAFQQGIEVDYVPYAVSPTITYGLYTALTQLIDRGLQKNFANTTLASKAFRAGARAMGIRLWAASEAIAADTATALVIPPHQTTTDFLSYLLKHHGVACTGTQFTGTPSAGTIRVGHMGVVQTEPAFVLQLLKTLGRAWEGVGATVDIRAGLQAARRVFAGHP